MKRRLVELLEHERIRFLLVGGINTAVGYALFVIFQLTIGQVIGYLGSLYLSYAVAVTVAFVGARRKLVQYRSSKTRPPRHDWVGD